MESSVQEVLASIERAQAARREFVSTLPCAGCEIDSETAQSCKVYDQSGCKHVVVLDARRQAEERAQNRRANMARAGIDLALLDEDPKLQMVLRETLEPWRSVHAVRRALASKSLRYLVLGGDHQTGKTLALIYACALRSEAVYISAQRLGRIQQDTSRWIDTKLLCVNELGREHLGNGFTASNLDEIMAERQYGGKLTIFATNLPLRKRNAADPNELPALADRYGDLFVSRMVPPVGAYVICGAGPVDVAPPESAKPFNERGEK